MTKITMYYEVLSTHPDFEGMSGQHLYKYEDVVELVHEDSIIEVKNDMLLIANGGYEYGHVKNVKFYTEGWTI